MCLFPFQFLHFPFLVLSFVPFIFSNHGILSFPLFYFCLAPSVSLLSSSSYCLWPAVVPLTQSFLNSWSPSDTPLSSLDPCDVPQLDMSRCRGLKPSVLFDLILMTGILEEPPSGSSETSGLPRNRISSEGGPRSELERCLDEDIARIMMDDEGTSCPAYEDRSKVEERREENQDDTFRSLIQSNEEHVSAPCPPILAPQPRVDFFALELRAVRISYLLLGALKSLAVILSCGKFTDLLLVPKSDAGANASSPDPARASAGGEEYAEQRSVLQFVVRSMVKWAVRPCPIKQAMALSDLERAQIIIFKGVLSRLHEDGSKEHKGLELVYYLYCWIIIIQLFILTCNNIIIFFLYISVYNDSVINAI